MPTENNASISLSPAVVAMVRRYAADKGILQGRPEALMERLESLGADLTPGGWSFPAFFAAGAGDASCSDLWRIGETFWHASGTSREARRLAGSFYTPRRVVDGVLELAEMDDGSSSTLQRAAICDPALGCGFFLLRLVERLLVRKKPAVVRDWAADSLYGIDKDPAAVFMARILLWLLLSDAKNEFLPDAAHFRCGDSLLGPAFGQTHGPDLSGDAVDWGGLFPEVAEAGGFSLIVGNPPYEVLTNFALRPERKELAEAIRRSGHYRDSLKGQVNLYRCFIERALDLLRPGGELAFLVPLSLARDAAASHLRRRLLLCENASQWVLYGERERLFPGVSQSFCAFAAKRDAGRVQTLSVWADGGKSSLELNELEACAGETLSIPSLGPGALDLWRRLWLCRGRLDDVADMRVGEVDQTFYRDCMADEDTGCVLARGAHLAAFRLDVEPTPGKERFLRLDRFLAKKGGSAGTYVERASVWRVAQLGIRNMHSRPRLLAALTPPGVYLGNSLNVYWPKAGVSPEYLAGVLNSSLLDWLFRLSSGNNNINLHEMRRLPFPATPPVSLLRDVEDAYRACAAAAEEREDGFAEEKTALDKAVARCYGIPGATPPEEA